MTESNIRKLLEALVSTGAWLGLFGTALVLALVLPRLRARGWLIASIGIHLTFHLWIAVGTFVRVLGSHGAYMDLWGSVWPLVGTANGAGFACLILFIYGQRAAANDRLSPGDILFPFRGRIARRHFWVASLALGLVSWVPMAAWLGSSRDTQKSALVAYGLWSLLILVPSFAVHVKRWHDRGKSGWMILVNLVPIVGPIWSFIETGCLPGTPGPNAYGDDPLAVASPQPQTAPPFPPAPSGVAEQAWRPLDFK
jgi:uncharacterized membrane protein YhaH (DUF805 family)